MSICIYVCIYIIYIYINNNTCIASSGSPLQVGGRCLLGRGRREQRTSQPRAAEATGNEPAPV